MSVRNRDAGRELAAFAVPEDVDSFWIDPGLRTQVGDRVARVGDQTIAQRKLTAALAARTFVVTQHRVAVVREPVRQLREDLVRPDRLVTIVAAASVDQDESRQRRGCRVRKRQRSGERYAVVRPYRNVARGTVSYTHLDVYKRQMRECVSKFKW